MTAALDVDEWGVVREAAGIVDMEALAASVKPRPPAPEPEPEAPPQPRFTTLPAFVAWVCSWYTRDVSMGSTVWCPEWWEYHPEGVIRLEACWRTYEKARLKADDGIASWLRDHLDVQMRGLMTEETSPWPRCNGQHRGSPLPLPLVEPPEDWWTEADSGL